LENFASSHLRTSVASSIPHRTFSNQPKYPLSLSVNPAIPNASFVGTCQRVR
jgi:hypothetical protein